MNDYRRYFVLSHDTARRLAAAQCQLAPAGWVVEIKPPTRTLEQNSAQFPYLQGFSEQLQWPVNGQMEWLTPLEWKDILTCAFEKEVNPRLAMGFDGGVVMLGKRTSKYGKQKFSEWYEWLMAAATLKGITPVYKGELNQIGEMR